MEGVWGGGGLLGAQGKGLAGGQASIFCPSSWYLTRTRKTDNCHRGPWGLRPLLMCEDISLGAANISWLFFQPLPEIFHLLFGNQGLKGRNGVH